MRRINSVKKGIARRLDIPEEAVIEEVIICIKGDEEVIIENHRGIVEYSRDNLRIAHAGGAVSIEGKELMIKEIDTDEIYITGSIISVEMVR